MTYMGESLFHLHNEKCLKDRLKELKCVLRGALTVTTFFYVANSFHV